APISGGGLACGLIEGLRSAGKQIPVIGSEPLLANDAARSMRADRIISNKLEPPTIADGARAISVGLNNWKILRSGLREIIEVPESKIAEALRMLFGRANLKVEPTGALSLAAVLTEPKKFRDLTVCCVASGGNVDAAAYAKLIAEESYL